MLVSWHGDTPGDADHADGGGAGDAGGLGALGKTEHRLWSARDRAPRRRRLGRRAIAREVGCARGVVSRRRVRFAKDRLAGPRTTRLGETEDLWRGRWSAHSGDADRPPPAGLLRAGTAPLLGQALADVSDQYIWRFLRAQQIDLPGRKSWCVSPDPDFAAKAADIVGLYLDPPDKAVVLALDEKPSIQALEASRAT